jgi:hypothetical protein
MELMGNNCEFNQYEFVTRCEEYCNQKFHTIPAAVYPILAQHSLLNNYLALMFVLQNLEKIKTGIARLEQDLKNKKVSESQAEYYLKWKEMLFDKKRTDAMLKTPSAPIPTMPKARTTLRQKNVQPLPPPISANPLYCFLYDGQPISGTSSSPIVLQRCMNCNSDTNKHIGYGAVSCCCGAFYCSECLESMATHIIVDSGTNTQHVSKDYYCCVCRYRRPKFYMNCSKKRDKNIYAFTLIEEYFKDFETLKSHLKVDYYFYMFLNGLTPLVKKGKPLNVHNDILQKAISLNDLKNNTTTPHIDPLLPKDQLAVNSIQTINLALSRLNIMPKKHSIILFYACPKYMQTRVLTQFNQIIKNNPADSRHKETQQQPISHMDIMFKDSVASLIGMHKNIIAIVLWRKLENQDNAQQMLGRCMRLNTFNTPLYFYITATNVDFN